MIYFTSDLHFGHANIIRYDNRPFSSVQEMDLEMIDRWNAKVNADDTVYILGDFSWYRSEETCEILKKLNGHKILITGNHDNRWLNGGSRRFFDAVFDYHELKIGNRTIVMSHYPILFFNKQHYGACMLYGHVHNSHEWHITENYKQELQRLGIHCNAFNVGCMIWDFEPVTLDEILSDQRFQPKETEGVED